MNEKKIAIIRIRGKTGVKRDISETLEMLHLSKGNTVAIIPETPDFMGMVKKVKDFTTYGEIKADVLKMLIEKKKNLSSKDSKIISFGLNPPKGGFERKGIKVVFKHKGALGYRAEKINDLILKMI